MKQTIRADLDELIGVLAGIQPAQAEAFFGMLKSHGRVFVHGKGRSGMVMSMFAMRLMHLGLNVHVIGEATAPALREGDLLIIGSGSGETEGCLLAARKASSLKAAVALVTAAPDSAIGRLSTAMVVLPCPTKWQAAKPDSPLLAGTLFEQSLLIFCDCLCARLASESGKDAASIMGLHSNIE